MASSNHSGFLQSMDYFIHVHFDKECNKPKSVYLAPTNVNDNTNDDPMRIYHIVIGNETQNFCLPCNRNHSDMTFVIDKPENLQSEIKKISHLRYLELAKEIEKRSDVYPEVDRLAVQILGVLGTNQLTFFQQFLPACIVEDVTHHLNKIMIDDSITEMVSEPKAIVKHFAHVICQYKRKYIWKMSKLLPITMYCCKYKCFEIPTDVVDGMACKKCKYFGYCVCRCKTRKRRFLSRFLCI
ncbi:hypothetical protein AVEN_246128-1 [Araneus ventricosus]|uniref:Uncharacterized protein n=1 Tax=Araneus ventricosus TaxID=182803 RepID=A0A4Y2JWH3_ARAVE|nr:hypothetical protein AVEN_246128-1 [Araneus ventricosus]